MFKKKTPKFYIIIAAAALLAAFCAWYFRPVTLNVALYSYVPDNRIFLLKPSGKKYVEQEELALKQLP